MILVEDLLRFAVFLAGFRLFGVFKMFFLMWAPFPLRLTL